MELIVLQTTTQSEKGKCEASVCVSVRGLASSAHALRQLEKRACSFIKCSNVDENRLATRTGIRLADRT